MDLRKDLVAASATPLVLAILAEGESYGYALIKRVKDLSDGQLLWTDGMLYPVLHRLEPAHPTTNQTNTRGTDPRAGRPEAVCGEWRGSQWFS